MSEVPTPPPGYPAHPGYPPAGPQAMMQMMQMMQMMMGGAPPAIDQAAQPFTYATPQSDTDPGLEADLVRPAGLPDMVRRQEALPVQEVLDLLCLTEDGKHALGGIPRGCTIAFAGPPGKGKTRSSIEALLRVARSATPCLFVVAEEGFSDDADSGRDPLGSRMVKIAMRLFDLTAEQVRETILPHITVLLAQYHKGHSWDDFVNRYRYVVEKEHVRFVVVDSLNMLDPTRTRTADNLSALKTYNHEKGITCLTIGQIRDTGQPVGGEALMHTADAVFLLEEMSMASKEMGSLWGAAYREVITVIRAVKCVTTPVLPYPVRVTQNEGTGCLAVHSAQPEQYPVLSPA